MLVRRVEYKEVERDMQKGGEDNSEGGIPFLDEPRPIEGIGDEDAHDSRREDVKEGRPDEAQVPGHHRLDDSFSCKRGEEERGGLEACEAEGDRDHVDDGVHRLIVLSPVEDGEPCYGVFRELLDGGPCRENSGLGDKIARDELLDGDDDDDREHACKKGEGNEPPRLRMYRILFEPEP